METNEFTIKDSLAIQAEQLKWCEKILKRRYWLMLKAHIDKLNKAGYKTAYSVFRGTEIDNWVANNCK